MAYYYHQDPNAYAADGATSSAVAYVRDSHLAHIDYGFTAGNAYANSGNAPERVALGTADRCFASACDPIASNAANWQDVPYTQDYCAATASCQVTGPTFWSTVRLSSIKTEQWNGSEYVEADSWALSQNFPPPGDGTSPTLFLDSITPCNPTPSCTPGPSTTPTGTGSGSSGGGNSTYPSDFATCVRFGYGLHRRHSPGPSGHPGRRLAYIAGWRRIVHQRGSPNHHGRRDSDIFHPRH